MNNEMSFYITTGESGGTRILLFVSRLVSVQSTSCLFTIYKSITDFKIRKANINQTQTKYVQNPEFKHSSGDQSPTTSAKTLTFDGTFGRIRM